MYTFRYPTPWYPGYPEDPTPWYPGYPEDPDHVTWVCYPDHVTWVCYPAPVLPRPRAIPVNGPRALRASVPYLGAVPGM